MAESERHIKVTLTAEVSGYIAGMEAAAAAAKRVSDALALVDETAKTLLACGIDPKDIPEAVKGAHQLAEASCLSAAEAARIVAKVSTAFNLTGDAITQLADTLAPKPTHGPDYAMTYIESTIQRLSNRGLTIMPVDVLTGLFKLHDAGINGKDAETDLYAFLERMVPFGAGAAWTAHTKFPGWAAIADDLNTAADVDRIHAFGHSLARVVAVMRSA